MTGWRRGQQEVSKASRGTFVPVVFAPGEAFQFDWSEDWVVIGGERMKLQVAQFKLCHSRAFMLRAYPLQTHEMLFDAHNHCLAALGGIPQRGIYDNMRTTQFSFSSNLMVALHRDRFERLLATFGDFWRRR